MPNYNIELNENIEVVGVEAIAESRVLLALKGTDLSSDLAICLCVVLDDGVAYPNNNVDLIARAITFNAYTSIDEPGQRDAYTSLFKRMLTLEATAKINQLLDPNFNKAVKLKPM